jgi:hypothetical protein
MNEYESRPLEIGSDRIVRSSDPDRSSETTETEDELTLFVCKGFSGEISRVTVSPDLFIMQAIPDIADQIGYYSNDWEKIGLYNLTRDFEYDLYERFAQTRTESGDMVVMADGAACHK